MKRLVVLSGAGISAESGISTFRDSGGLWDRYPVEDVATPEGWQRNPTLVTEFYNRRRREMLDAQPNEAHRLVAALEEEYEVTVVTQNVDNLHERAGSSHVIHLHGELMKVCSSRDPDNPFHIRTLQPEEWEVRLDAGCGMSFSAVHKVRAEACARLEEALLAPYASRELADGQQGGSRSLERHAGREEPCVCALVTTPDAAEAARELAPCDGEFLSVVGVGANFSCASGVLPSEKNLTALVDCGRAFEAELGRKLEIYSGGGT